MFEARELRRPRVDRRLLGAVECDRENISDAFQVTWDDEARSVQ